MSTVSTEQLAVVYNISRTNIQRILKYHKFHPYKIKLQELNEDDFDRRLQFCERLTNKVLSLFLVSVFPINVLFLNGTMNRHNCRSLADYNPRLYHSQKLNIRHF